MDAENDPRTFAIIGAAIEVHRHLGRGFLEGVYQEALAMEFESRQVPFARETELPITYKGKRILGVDIASSRPWNHSRLLLQSH